MYGVYDRWCINGSFLITMSYRSTSLHSVSSIAFCISMPEFYHPCLNRYFVFLGWLTPEALLLPKSRVKPVELGMGTCPIHLPWPKSCWRQKGINARPTDGWNALSTTMHVTKGMTWCLSMTLSSCTHQPSIIPSNLSTRMTGFAVSPISYVLPT